MPQFFHKSRLDDSFQRHVRESLNAEDLRGSSYVQTFSTFAFSLGFREQVQDFPVGSDEL
jgi:hypothetical protein